MDKPGHGRIKRIGRQGAGGIRPDQGCDERPLSVVVIQAIPLASVGEGVAGNQPVGTFGNHMSADMIGSPIDIYKPPARPVVGAVLIAGSMDDECLEC